MKYFFANPDSHLVPLFNSIADNINVPADSIFVHPTQLHQLDSILKEKVVLIFFNDTDNISHEYSYWNQVETIQLTKIKKIVGDNLDKVFIIVMEDNKLVGSEFQHNNRVQVINTNLFFSNQSKLSQIIPASNKNFSSTRVGIALSRQMRVHRIALASLLYGLNLDQFCYVSAMHINKQLKKINSDNFMDHCPWMFEENHTDIQNWLGEGFKKLYLNKDIKEVCGPALDIYPTDNNTILKFTNIENYRDNLFPLYTNSFVEFVSETIYDFPSHTVTEKFLNSVYGYNFPIIVSSPGTVEYLRDCGFDMFDDVVNHSYDLVEHPIDRIKKLVLDNQQLLVNHNYTKDIWSKNIYRFDKNFQWATNNIYTVWQTQTLQQCNRLISNFLKEPFNV